MLGHVPRGAHGTQGEVREVSPRAPDLLSIDDVVVAVALCGGQQTGQIGAPARLGEQLQPHFLTGQDAAQVRRLLLVGTKPCQGGTEDVDRDTEELVRMVEARRFLQEDALVLQG